MTSTVHSSSSCLYPGSSPNSARIFVAAVSVASAPASSTTWTSISTPRVGPSDGLKTIFISSPLFSCLSQALSLRESLLPGVVSTPPKAMPAIAQAIATWSGCRGSCEDVTAPACATWPRPYRRHWADANTDGGPALARAIARPTAVAVRHGAGNHHGLQHFLPVHFRGAGRFHPR